MTPQFSQIHIQFWFHDKHEKLWYVCVAWKRKSGKQPNFFSMRRDELNLVAGMCRIEQQATIKWL